MKKAPSPKRRAERLVTRVEAGGVLCDCPSGEKHNDKCTFSKPPRWVKAADLGKRKRGA